MKKVADMVPTEKTVIVILRFEFLIASKKKYLNVFNFIFVSPYLTILNIKFFIS